MTHNIDTAPNMHQLMRGRMAHPLLDPHPSVIPRHLDQVGSWRASLSWHPAQHVALEMYPERIRPDSERVDTIDSFPRPRA